MPSKRLPTVQQRLARLEQAVHDLVMVTTSGRPHIMDRTLSASGNGRRLYEYLLTLKDEEPLRESITDSESES